VVEDEDIQIDYEGWVTSTLEIMEDMMICNDAMIGDMRVCYDGINGDLDFGIEIRL
jgi:hypothetical protein